ncbi:uncharacterized protein LOC131891302 [Tigriopus californicus]|uniref:uncharacterized protein LOC131891302 n=1 Tax=Tigriopus californicus TaxID=6832 RepID=UPI0027DA0F8E|nr:uncharacterized protein LOC131891302 [Tigriopus californicus]
MLKNLLSSRRILIIRCSQGMQSDSDKAKTMERNPKSFEEARKFILELETSRRGAREFSSVASSHPVNAVDQTVNGTKSNYKKKGGKSAFKKWGSSEKCPFCGNPKWHSREECPASRSSCHGCGRNGHWLQACRSKSQSKNYSARSPQEDKKASGVLLDITCNVQNRLQNRIDVLVSPKGSLKSVKMQFCADTGADVTIIGMNQFRDSDLCQLIQAQTCVKCTLISGVGGRPLDLFGTFQTDLSIGQNHVARGISVVVSSDLDDAYLSLDACRALGIVI